MRAPLYMFLVCLRFDFCTHRIVQHMLINCRARLKVYIFNSVIHALHEHKHTATLAGWRQNRVQCRGWHIIFILLNVWLAKLLFCGVRFLWTVLFRMTAIFINTLSSRWRCSNSLCVCAVNGAFRSIPS